MIICLTHGSSNEEVNQKQSRCLFTAIQQKYVNCEVKEAFYSHVVNRRLQKKGLNYELVESIISDNYAKESQFVIVLTTLIDGIEQQRILDKVKFIDTESKVTVIDPLLSLKNFPMLNGILSNINQKLLLVAHGNNSNADHQYQQFEQYLLNHEIKCKLITLKDDVNYQKIKKEFNDIVCVFPLMMIQAHHTKFDINQKIIPKLIECGLVPTLYDKPLITNETIIKHYLDEIGLILNKE